MCTNKDVRYTRIIPRQNANSRCEKTYVVMLHSPGIRMHTSLIDGLGHVLPAQLLALLLRTHMERIIHETRASILVGHVMMVGWPSLTTLV